jgi:hypothetical protein
MSEQTELRETCREVAGKLGLPDSITEHAGSYYLTKHEGSKYHLQIPLRKQEFLILFAAHVRAHTSRHHDWCWLITDECVSVYKGRNKIRKEREGLAVRQHDDTDPLREARAVVMCAQEGLEYVP